MRKLFVATAAALSLGLLGASWAAAEDLGPDQARAFVVGKLFSYTCFEGTSGAGRIFPDGSVVGTIRIRGVGETRFATLPPGTIRADGTQMCAHLSGLPITPCFHVQRIDDRSFRGSIAGLDFAYCNFSQSGGPRPRLVGSPTASSAATPISSD